MQTSINFVSGSLTINHLNPECRVPGVIWDARIDCHRATANLYRDIILYYTQHKLEYVDHARLYQKLPVSAKKAISPRYYQKEAIDAWQKSGMIGTICLPTGAGKTILALQGIFLVQRPTLVVVPTIDLLHQWQKTIMEYIDLPVGIWGDGYFDTQSITVSTYDSASMQIENKGNFFGLLIFDECHHLPAPHYQKIAYCALAPFRMGLSATLERSDGKESLIYELVGPLVYTASIKELVEKHLAPYDIITIKVPLSEEEREDYHRARQQYVAFVKQLGINMASPQGWQEFIKLSSRTPHGRLAFRAYMDQKRIAQGAASKSEVLWELLKKHAGERMIVFTDNNDFAYQLGSKFLLPVITHKTRSKERKEMLRAFRAGEFSVLVTSKVLNEGVDVPEASVGVVLSGNATVREHVQRLGRILRQQEGKKAFLYEVITQDTAESFVSTRRRQHHAYQK